MDRRTFLSAAVTAAAAVLGACTPDTLPGPRRPPALTMARKGVGLSRLKEFGIDQLNSLDPSWFYTWGANYPSTAAAPRPDSEFVPMIWGRGSLERRAIELVRSESSWTGAGHLLGFNEPDHEGQAELSVDAAVELWPQLEHAGLRLGSPAPVQALGDWLQGFMDRAAARDLRVDFVAMHSYTPPHADSFLRTVQKLHERYELPVWVTEYAVADWKATAKSPSRFTETEILRFMDETVSGLREMPFVERFAWKTRADGDPIMGASALFRTDGSLTPTGELYRSL